VLGSVRIYGSVHDFPFLCAMVHDVGSAHQKSSGSKSYASESLPNREPCKACPKKLVSVGLQCNFPGVTFNATEWSVKFWSIANQFQSGECISEVVDRVCCDLTSSI